MEPAYPVSAHDVPKRRTPWNTISARIISVISRKGGVGKTTSAVNLGAAFALSGHSVLVIGVDPQCGVAPTLGAHPADLGTGLLDLWDHDADLTDLAQPSELKDLFFVSPRVLDMDDERRFLDAMQQRPDVFTHQLDRARNLYDTILIDCPPHLGAPTRAAISAADGLLLPTQSEELCRESLGALLGAIDVLKDEHGIEALDGPQIEGILLTMHAQHTRMGRHVAARVAEEFGPVLLDTVVPRTTRLSEMALRGKPSVIYDRRSAGSRAYFNLADELLTRHRQREGQEFTAGIERTTGVTTSARQQTVQRGDRGGLERLLGDLQATGNRQAPQVPLEADDYLPDLVSLDDLLAEEEHGHQSWNPSWPGDPERLN